ncbi:MAG: transporter substrate-binding domain-containing protein [Roseburia sp.]|nr:transporter substrate-binding domain-containing protein [Roseburia sp.]
MKTFQRKYGFVLVFMAAVMLSVLVWDAAPVKALEKRTVRIPCGVNELLYFDDDGNVAGYCKDYLDRLAEINKWEYEYVKADWSEAVQMLQDGGIDLLMPTTWKEEREETMDFSSMVAGYMAPGLFARRDSNYHYEDYQGFDGARIAVTEDSVNNEELAAFAKKNGFSYEAVYITAMEDKIKALEAGEVDMVIFSAANEVPDSKLVSVLEAEPFYYTVKKGNTELLAELNSGMQQIMMNAPELVGEVFGSCITGPNSNGTNIAFTAEERAFIENGTKVTIGFYEHTEPLAYVASDGSYQGIYVELLQKVGEKTGLNIELMPISRDDNWKDLVKAGKIDFYVGSQRNITAKDEDFIPTSSFMDYKSVLITESDHQMHKDEKMRVALTRGRSYWVNNLPDDFENAEIIYCRTAKDCLLAVSRGEADATLINTIEFNYQSKNARFSDLVQWENYRFTSGTCMTALSDIDKVMYSVMNKSLRALTETEINDVTDKNLNKPYQNTDWIDYLYPVRDVLIILSILIVVGIIVASFAYRIRKKHHAELYESQEKERQQLRIMAALSREYASVYYVNLDEDSYTIVNITDRLREEVTDIAKQSHVFSETLRQYADTFVLPEYQEIFRKASQREEILKRFQSDKDFSVRYQVKPNPAKQEYFEMHFVDVSTNEDEHIVVAGFRCVDEIARDEIEKKKALEEAFEAANRANHAKSDFLSKMSHDIRTPMNAIIGMTAIAAAHVDDKERVQDALGKITSSSRHLLGLINEVLDMSKIESGKINLSEEDLNLSELLNDLLIIVQPQIKEHGHDLQVHILDMEHEDVIGDRLRIQQVFVNIMGNAVKYTPDGGKLRLTVREKPTNKRMIGCYEFVFEDNGIGMSEEYVEHIFEPFSRAEDSRSSKIQGTGLGMAITQNIIHMMGGHIQVESELGKGSKFTVMVFLKLQDKEELSYDEFTGLPVLVADDDQISCETTCKMLDEIGMNSEWVLSGQEAVERVTETHEADDDFYAVILDWKMPGMDGLDTARAIRQVVGPEVPLIILSAYDWSEIEIEAREAGVDAFLNKPVFKSGLTRVFHELKHGKAEEGVDSQLEKVTQRDYSGKRVLLVEDIELNREIAREILGMTEIKIEEAENGKVAVDMFSASENGYYDIVLMDVQMPVMNGYDATSAIRELDRADAKTVPIVAMTANAFAEDIRDAKAAGMNEHLAKPFDFGKLTEILERYLNL